MTSNTRSSRIHLEELSFACVVVELLLCGSPYNMYISITLFQLLLQSSSFEPGLAS